MHWNKEQTIQRFQEIALELGVTAERSAAAGLGCFQSMVRTNQKIDRESDRDRRKCGLPVPARPSSPEDALLQSLNSMAVGSREITIRNNVRPYVPLYQDDEPEVGSETQGSSGDKKSSSTPPSIPVFRKNPESETLIMHAQSTPAPSQSQRRTAERNGSEAARFMEELLDSVESLVGIAEEHGQRTLADLMYLQNTILTGGCIDVYPEESKVMEVVRDLPSGQRWTSFMKVEYMKQVGMDQDLLANTEFKPSFPTPEVWTDELIAQRQKEFAAFQKTDAGIAENRVFDAAYSDYETRRENGDSCKVDALNIVNEQTTTVPDVERKVVVVMEGGQVQQILVDGKDVSVAVVEYDKRALKEEGAVLIPQGDGSYAKAWASVPGLQVAPARVAQLYAAVETGPSPDWDNVVSAGNFVGPVVAIDRGVVTQRINRQGDTALHDASELSQAVRVGDVVDIAYVHCRGMVKSPAKSTEIGR